MIDISNFDWGWMNEGVLSSDGQGFITHIHPEGNEELLNEYHKKSLIDEIFVRRIYEKYFEVESNDIVVDIGASLGPFTYSILHKNPKHVFCFEPSKKEFKTLINNTIGNPVTQIFKGIGPENSIIENSQLFGGENEMESIKFSTFVDLYSIGKIDFMKTDCEGGEYDIFNDENIDFILSNVKKISGEWHLNTPENKNKFRNFRDNYLTKFEKYEINSIDGFDIKWDLWNEHFIEYYSEVIVYIDNR